jgi:hypothetical protein
VFNLPLFLLECISDKLMRKKTPFEAQEEGGLVFYLNKGEKGQAAGRQR